MTAQIITERRALINKLQFPKRGYSEQTILKPSPFKPLMHPWENPDPPLRWRKGLHRIDTADI